MMEGIPVGYAAMVITEYIWEKKQVQVMVKLPLVTESEKEKFIKAYNIALVYFENKQQGNVFT